MSLLSAAIQLIRSGFTPQMPGFMQYAQKLGETDSMPPAATDIGNVYPDHNGGYNRGLEPGQVVPISGGDWRANATSIPVQPWQDNASPSPDPGPMQNAPASGYANQGLYQRFLQSLQNGLGSLQNGFKPISDTLGHLGARVENILQGNQWPRSLTPNSPNPYSVMGGGMWNPYENNGLGGWDAGSGIGGNFTGAGKGGGGALGALQAASSLMFR